MDLNVKCKNRKPFLDEIEVQIGWHADGRRKTELRKNPMSKSCQFDLRLTQAGCQGCIWQVERDPRDGPDVRRVDPLISPAPQLVPSAAGAEAVPA